MPPPKSPKVRAKAIELAKAGHSARTIEQMLDGLGLAMGKSAVAALVKEYRANPNLGAESPAPVAEGPSSEGDESPCDLDLSELRELSTLFGDKLRLATDSGDVRLAKGLLEARLVTAREIARLRPATPPDPARDPANVEAREELRARLERLREASRASEPARAQARAWLDGGQV